MKDLNKVIFVGRLAADPVIKTTSTGQPMANLRLATNAYWRDSSGEMQTKTDFHDVVAWRNVAESITDQLHKGDSILVEAKLQPRKWQTADGQPRRSIDIVATRIVSTQSDDVQQYIKDVRQALQLDTTTQ